MKQDIMEIDFNRPSRLFSFPALLDEAEDWLLPSSRISGLSMSEDEKNIYVEAAVPGIEPKDVEVTYDKGTLWIRGQAKQEEEDKNRKYYRKASSSFSYRLSIPETADQTAEPQVISKNGLLTVTFQKQPKTQPKKLTVKEE